MQMKLNVTLITSSAGAKSMGAIRVQKDARCTAKRTEAAEDVKIWDVRKALKAKLITA